MCRNTVAHHHQASCMVMTADARVDTTATRGGESPSAALWDPGTGRKCCESDACCAADSWRCERAHQHQCAEFEGAEQMETCTLNAAIPTRSPAMKNTNAISSQMTPQTGLVSVFSAGHMYSERTLRGAATADFRECRGIGSIDFTRYRVIFTKVKSIQVSDEVGSSHAP